MVLVFFYRNGNSEMCKYSPECAMMLVLITLIQTAVLIALDSSEYSTQVNESS